jgi:hypothetical protein
MSEMRPVLVLEAVVLSMVVLLAYILVSDPSADAASFTTTTISTYASPQPLKVSAAAIYGLPVNASGVTFFTRSGRTYFGYYNGTHYIVIDTVSGSVYNAFKCNAKTIASGYQTAYVVCDTDVYDVYSGKPIYHLPDVPSFIIYDYYSDRILAFINAYPAMAVVVVFDPSGETIYSGTWTGWMVYGAAADGDSYYLTMYNAASGWWLAKYDKGFSRTLANISIATPMNANVTVAKYSGLAANDLGVVLVNGNGSITIYTKDLKPVYIVSGSFTRVEASKYHFYLMDSSKRIYVASASGAVYSYGLNGEVRYTLMSKEMFVADKGVAYDSANGVLYLMGPPSDLVFVTVTNTMYMLYYVTRTYEYTETTTVYGFLPVSAQLAVFIALIVLVIGIYKYLSIRKR